MTTRAVHLEMCHDLSSDATLTALRGIFARRGTPSEICSDNATNFTAAENHFLGYHQISWKFNPAYAPHFGGVWKRLIRSAKNSLYAIIVTKYECTTHHDSFSLRHRSLDPQQFPSWLNFCQYASKNKF